MELPYYFRISIDGNSDRRAMWSVILPQLGLSRPLPLSLLWQCEYRGSPARPNRQAIARLVAVHPVQMLSKERTGEASGLVCLWVPTGLHIGSLMENFAKFHEQPEKTGRLLSSFSSVP